MSWSKLLLATVCAAAFAPTLARADATSDAGDKPKAVAEVVITAQRLDKARASIQPDTGASTYTVDNAAIDLLPGGANVSFNQLVLQMPGVAQDQFGQLHMRGDHANIQYRFDGVILPEGLSFFGQVVDTRMVDQVKMLTGALPAEFGLRTAGVLDITTKDGIRNGGEVSIYGGSHGDWQPSIEYGGASGNNTYFATASYMQNQLGIDSVDGSSTPRHDRTTQENAFGYFDHIIDDNSRVSFFAGFTNQTFQIPDPVGQQPSNGYVVNGRATFPSQTLNQNQREKDAFAAGSYLYTTGNFSGQVSLYTRYSSLDYMPDAVGELLYNGFEQSASKEDIAVGLQAEGAYKLGDRHTVRAGLIVENDRSNSASTGQAFLADTDVNDPNYGNALASNSLATVVDDGSANAQTYSAYLQDEWKVFDNFVLNYGLRFDQLASFRKENQLSPRVNFVWTPLPGTTINGGYSRYFTPPPFELVNNETLSKYFGTVNYPYALAANPNQKLDTTPYSERDNYFDLGVQQKLTRALTLGVDAYFRTAKNLIDEGQFGEAIIETPFNYKHGKIHGGDVTLNYNKGPFSAYWNVAYVRAMGEGIESSQFNFDPDELAYIAHHYIFLDHNETWSSSFGAAYRWRDTKVSLDGIYGSGLRTDSPTIPNGYSLPSYTTFNLSVLQHVDWRPTGPLDLRFDIVNLLDKAYEIRDGGGVGVGAPSWGARRGVFVGLSKPF